MTWYYWIWLAGSVVTLIILMNEIRKSNQGLDANEAFSALMIVVGWWAIIVFYFLNSIQAMLKEHFNKGSNHGSK